MSGRRRLLFLACSVGFPCFLAAHLAREMIEASSGNGSPLRIILTDQVDYVAI